MNKVLIERSERKFKEVSEEIVIEIIDYWNSHEGFKKNTKTEKGISDIKRSFHKYDIEEFKKYIDRYYEITKETEYFFNYRWDLVTFIRHKNTI